MPLHLYNTLSRQKEEFTPMTPGVANVYWCGITPYAPPHIGHGRNVVAQDVLRRWLAAKGYRVTVVENITDIDDKIIRRAQENQEDPLALAVRFSQEFVALKQKLNVKAPDAQPRVTEFIPQIVSLVAKLIERGHAYALPGGDVYFDVSTAPTYGELARLDAEQLKAGARIEPDPRKRNPADFALWKSKKPGEPFWPSPWGDGRPGWHIECSAMNAALLGPSFDIHGGGSDLIFPHHVNEIAQSEGAHGCPPARYWVHNGMVMINGEKMSKSLGNFVTLDQFLAQVPGPVARYAFLTAHYRDPYDYTLARVEASKTSWSRVRDTLVALAAASANAAPADAPDAVREAADAAWRAFETAMDDDLNTAGALTAVHGLRDVAQAYLQGPVNAGGVRHLLAVYTRMLDALGLPTQTEVSLPQGVTREWVEALVELRQAAKREKKFAVADSIRDELKAKGILLEDKGKDVVWKVAV